MEISERQLEIIEAASGLLTRQGLMGLTIKNLAKEMEFSESAIYRHFASKEEIIVTMLTYLRVDMQGRLAQALQCSTHPVDQLRAVFANQFDFFARHNHFVIIILSEGLLEYTEAVQQALLSLVLTKKAILDDIVERAQKEGIFSSDYSTEFLTHTIMGTFRLLMLKWRMARFSFNLPEMGNFMLDQTLALLQSKP